MSARRHWSSKKDASQVLATVEPGAPGWAFVAIGSLVPLVIGQLLKPERVRWSAPPRLVPQPTG